VGRLTGLYKPLLSVIMQITVFQHLYFLKHKRRKKVWQYWLSKKGNSFCAIFFVFGCFFTPTSIVAEVSLEFYGGYQTSPHSVVSGNYFRGLPSVESSVPFKFTAGWKGNSFSMPPYYGVRVTDWNMNKGWGLDFNHSKAYADASTLLESGFARLQFTDGLNNLTIHQQRKLKMIRGNLIPLWLWCWNNYTSCRS
jgi:hypothetical protein